MKQIFIFSKQSFPMLFSLNRGRSGLDPSFLPPNRHSGLGPEHRSRLPGINEMADQVRHDKTTTTLKIDEDFPIFSSEILTNLNQPLPNLKLSVLFAYVVKKSEFHQYNYPNQILKPLRPSVPSLSNSVQQLYR